MNPEDAVARVREYVRDKYPDYPTEDLVAHRFSIGWSVFPRNDWHDISEVRCGQTGFLVGDTGEIMETSGSLPPNRREDEFIRRYGSAS